MTKKLSFVMALSALTGIFMCSCDDDSNTNTNTTPICTENTWQCSATGVPQKCVAGSWTNQVACQPGQTCDKGVCTGTPTDDKKCTADKCKAKTGKDYSGNVCIEDGTVFCGCESLKDCNTGYECKNKLCVVYEPCDKTKCAAKTGNDYVGNVCVLVGGEQQCGCNSNSDCNTGYTCKDKKCSKQTEASCDATACSNKLDGEYKGNKCITQGATQVCGCNLSSDCRDGYECNANVCTVPGCNPTVCKNESGNSYHGNACVDDAGGNKVCGCDSDNDCKSGYKCNQIVGLCSKSSDSDCDASACAAELDYYGSACVDNGFNGLMCGCDSNADCKEGFSCDTEMHECESDIECDPDACNEDTKNYKGSACVDDGIGGEMCGCDDNDDCKSGYTCNEDLGVCVNDGGETKVCSQLKLLFPSSESCEKFQEINTDVSKCEKGDGNHEYTLTYSCGAVVHIKASNITASMANLKKPGTDYYITIDKIASGTNVSIVWQLGTDKYSANQLKVSELNNPSAFQLFTATAKDADMNSAFALSKSGSGVKFEHGGNTTNVIKIKSISVH